MADEALVQPGGGGGPDQGGLAGLQKLLRLLPSFQGQFGNIGVKFNPQESLLKQALLERLTGGLGGQGLGSEAGQVPPIPQTPTVQPIPFGSQPLGILQEQGLGTPGLANFPFLGRIR